MTSKIGAGKPGTFALLNGDEAVARGAVEAAVKVAASYPGTPATEILETLADVAMGLGLNQEGDLRVGVGLDEAGRHHQSLGIDDALGLGPSQLSQGGDLPPLYSHIGPEPGVPRPIDDFPIGDKDIEIRPTFRHLRPPP